MVPILIIGLGNPGKEYDGTRHNVGREIVDAISRNDEFRMTNSEWHDRKSLDAEMLECELGGQRVILAKPTTYMNESGRAVSALVKQLGQVSGVKCQVLVVHDDLDLPLGTLRLSQGGSSGGHKGVQSIIDALGTKDFLRLRIGIGPNETPDGHRIPSEKFVLEKFRTEERGTIDAAVARAVDVILMLIRDGLPAAQRFTDLH